MIKSFDTRSDSDPQKLNEILSKIFIKEVNYYSFQFWSVQTDINKWMDN